MRACHRVLEYTWFECIYLYLSFSLCYYWTCISSLLCITVLYLITDCVPQAGGCAGMCVDLTLFPLDTIKTRLQSQQGFYKAGGFRGIYAGVPSAAVGSFPNGKTIIVMAGWCRLMKLHRSPLCVCVWRIAVNQYYSLCETKPALSCSSYVQVWHVGLSQ